MADLDLERRATEAEDTGGAIALDDVRAFAAALDVSLAAEERAQTMRQLSVGITEAAPRIGKDRSQPKAKGFEDQRKARRRQERKSRAAQRRRR